MSRVRLLNSPMRSSLAQSCYLVRYATSASMNKHLRARDPLLKDAWDVRLSGHIRVVQADIMSGL